MSKINNIDFFHLSNFGIVASMNKTELNKNRWLTMNFL